MNLFVHSPLTQSDIIPKLGAPRSPDVLLIGAELSILFHSGLKVSPNAALNVSAPIDPYYWVLPSGAPIDRSKMMVVLNNLKGVYIKASYGLDKDGQARYNTFTLCHVFDLP